MSVIHFLNVLEGDCNIIQHDSGRVTVIDISNASNEIVTIEEQKVKSSLERTRMFTHTGVPTGKTDYRQKASPDNPIEYLRKFNIEEIFRFIITHPDMDHLDGIRDLFESVRINCFWDTDNKKVIENFGGGGYNKEDWEFYTRLRDGHYRPDVRRAFLAGNIWNYFDQDNIRILAPTEGLIREAVQCGDYNDSSYVFLYTPRKRNGGNWKILFAGDSHDKTWEYILNNYKAEVSNVDILFAPHHGRHSDRSWDFVQVLKPRITLFGNASSQHLAYDCYPETRITNNQAGYVIMDITEDNIHFFVKNLQFANDFRNNPKRQWGNTSYNARLDAYLLCAIS